MAGYTVIDFETTGFSPRHGDRIVEIGVVKVSHQGEVYDAWGTLVNPRRDVGASHIHGITARDVAKAPTFDEIAPALLDAIDGRVIAAHNAGFDTRFLSAELMRAGYPVADIPVPAVCTMEWSRAFLRSTSRRLCDCCESADIELTHAHSALGDALATAQLLAEYLRRSSYRPAWEQTLTAARSFPWPAHSSCGQVSFRQRSDTTNIRPDGWLDRIIARLPRSADTQVDAYLAVLDMAMLDGHLSFHEENQLVEVARACSLSRPQVLAIHADFLTAMAVIALSDGFLATEERSQLDCAAACLGLASRDVDDALEAAASGDATSNLVITGIHLAEGDRVTFTGDMALERSVWEGRARAAGLKPAGLAKSTKLLVAADPDSLSGKASKARSYGIPIVDEAAFQQLIAALDS